MKKSTCKAGIQVQTNEEVIPSTFVFAKSHTRVVLKDELLSRSGSERNG